jgi:phosphate butyryltransferase
MTIKCFDDLVSEAKKAEKKTVIAVVQAQDEHTLESVVEATNDGIMTPMLIGDEMKIATLLNGFGADAAKFDIRPSGSVEQSLKLAVEMVHAGKATAIMKGKLETADFVKAVVTKDNNLMMDGKLSVAGFFTPPEYHKLLAVSDMGLMTYPDLDAKKAIIENAVRMLNSLGFKMPKVAVLAAVEKLNPKMPETVDADALKTMNANGEIANCIVEGPISFDLATSAESAKIKGYESPVAGDADLLVVPDIVSGNILVKCLTGMAGATTAGAVLGAKVPVILTSRSAEAADKYYSIALAACLATGMPAVHSS